MRLSAFLRLTHTEEQELFRAYRQLCEGKWTSVFDAIDRHLALLKRLDTPTRALEMHPSMRKQDYTRAEGAYLVEDLLWQALSSGRMVDCVSVLPAERYAHRQADLRLAVHDPAASAESAGAGDAPLALSAL